MTTVAILGAGPGGYSAAFEAAKQGAEKVYLIEHDHVGGTCLNYGCVPTKTVLRSAHCAHEIASAGEVGIEAPVTPKLNLDHLRARKIDVVEKLRAQIMAGVKRHKVEFVAGTGVMTGAHQITVMPSATAENAEPLVIDADVIIIATGSLPFKLPMINHDLDNVWTSDEALELDRIPEEIVICGGGVIGAEFACAYAAFGSKVTVVELSPTLLPGNDKRVTRALATAFKAKGIEVLTETSVTSVEEAPGNRVAVHLSNDETVEADVLLSAVGRIPNTAGFGYEEVGLEFDRRALKANEYFETNIEGVYAIGDAIAGMMLAHVSEAEAKAAVRNAFARRAGKQPQETVNYQHIPACVYTFPEVSVVGMTLDKAKAEGKEAVSAIAKFAGNAKALAENDADGFIQLVADKSTGEILGCQMLGAHSVELIHEVSNAMTAGLTARDLAAPVYSHPTVSEVVMTVAEMIEEKRA